MTLEGSSEGYINPGGLGEAPRSSSILDPDLYATRSDLRGGIDSLWRPHLGPGLHVTIVARGLRTVATHAAAVDEMIPGAIGVIHQVTGRLTVQEARRSIEQDFSRPPIDSGDTYNSIHSRLETSPNTVITSVGPTTFYSPLIEFGLARHFTYGPRPFMSNAFYVVLPQHLQALRDLARVATIPRARITGKEHGPPTNAFLRKFRNLLYTVEKEIGDYMPFGGVPKLGAFRESLILLARGLGDIQAVVGSAVGARFIRRLEGKVTGRLIGIGSHTVFASQSFGARISGGERIYNRYAGKYMSRFMGQNNVFRGGGFG